NVVVEEEAGIHTPQTIEEIASENDPVIPPQPINAKTTRQKRSASAEATGIRRSARLQLKQAGSSGPVTRSRCNSAPAPTSSAPARSPSPSTSSTPPSGRSSKAPAQKSKKTASRGKRSKSQ
ncbi:hypothetical protein FRC02_003171, partial [Tulasnella sp. 418]